MLSEKIGLKIKFEREKRGISQEDFALQAGLSRNAIWKIETGRVEPTLSSLEKIAKVFDMDVITLIDITKFEL